MDKIMVCLSKDKQWTAKAVQLACGLAKDIQAEIVLVKMIPVDHLSWLNSEAGYAHLQEDDFMEAACFGRICTDDGVAVSFLPFQYYTLADAIVDAADYLNAGAVFATLPPSLVKPWHRFQMKSLEHHLNAHRHSLYALDKPLLT